MTPDIEKHELVGNSFYIEQAGVIGRCTCGWNTGHRFSSFAAAAAFLEHQEKKGVRKWEENE